MSNEGVGGGRRERHGVTTCESFDLVLVHSIREYIKYGLFSTNGGCTLTLTNKMNGVIKKLYTFKRPSNVPLPPPPLRFQAWRDCAVRLTLCNSDALRVKATLMCSFLAQDLRTHIKKQTHASVYHSSFLSSHRQFFTPSPTTVDVRAAYV